MPALTIARSKFNNLVSTVGTVAVPIKYSSKSCSNFQRHRHMQAWGRSLQWYWSNDRLEIDDIINDLDERGWTRESECVRESVSGWDCVYVCKREWEREILFFHLRCCWCCCFGLLGSDEISEPVKDHFSFLGETVNNRRIAFYYFAAKWKELTTAAVSPLRVKNRKLVWKPVQTGFYLSLTDALLHSIFVHTFNSNGTSYFWGTLYLK